MDEKKVEKIKLYAARNKKRIFALKNWIALNVKPFTTMDAMLCIYDYCNGNSHLIDNVIDELTTKKKTFGRTQVYSDIPHKTIDIIKDNGIVRMIGDVNTSNNKPTIKPNRNPNIFRKSDNQVKKIYQQTSEKLHNIGQFIREIYPNASKTFIALAIVAIRKYAQEKKINTDKVINGIKNGSLFLDDDTFVIRRVNNEQKIIIIDENMARIIKEDLQMTKYKFVNAIKKFLHDILIDPVNATPPPILSLYGYNRYKLLRYLINYNIIEKEERIIDTDENGNPSKVTMKVKYKVPKKNFERKVDRLYIRFFEKNTPDKDDIVTEDGEAIGATGSDASGQYNQPLFGLQRRHIYDIDETTSTFNVGDYQYDVPFCNDKEASKRRNGIGGSVSVNKV